MLSSVNNSINYHRSTGSHNSNNSHNSRSSHQVEIRGNALNPSNQEEIIGEFTVGQPQRRKEARETFGAKVQRPLPIEKAESISTKQESLTHYLEHNPFLEGMLPNASSLQLQNSE